MLGSLARKLRAFGFDTCYYKTGSDEGIMAVARNQGRTVLTSDRSLRDRAASKGMAVILVTGRTDGMRIASLIEGAREVGMRLVRGERLCSLCGGGLARVPRAEATSSVPPVVARRHRLFFRCTMCGHIYWRGGHWKKLRRLERAFGNRKRPPVTLE